MNYVREINAFYDWLETNSISDSAIVLWHALMHINNKAGWITEFAVAISTLETKTGMKKDAIIRARNRLAQVGRITFKSRQGQQSAIYSIVPFIGTSNDCVALSDTNSDTNCVTNREQTATQTTTQTASINKLNEKETKKDISAAAKNPTKKFIPPSLEQVQAYCLERNNGIDANKWINHYTANGWMVGKNKMKDWKAAVRTWEGNDKFGPQKVTPIKKKPAADEGMSPGEIAQGGWKTI